jgi:hypothetical protein
MSALLDLVAKAISYQKKQAILVATRLKAALQPDALLLAPIVMAGEETALHAIALGTRGQNINILMAADPRDREESNLLLAQLGVVIESYFASCRARGTFPQLIVSSSSEARCLDALSERCRAPYQPEAIQRLGALLAYPCERYEIAGQQCLLSAASLLREHYVFGQSDSEHLGALLHWMHPTQASTGSACFWEDLRSAEESPMGLRTSVIVDRALEPILKERKEAKQRNAPRRTLEALHQQAHQLLAPEVTRRYQAIESALSVLESNKLSYLQPLQQLSQMEAEEFAHFMESRDKGFFIAKQDSAKAATFKLSSREDSFENYSIALLYHDPIEQARARMSGVIVDATVEAIELDTNSKRHRVTLRSQQSALHLRKHDELCLLSDPRLQVVVLDIQKTSPTASRSPLSKDWRGFGVQITVEITKGMRAVGLPTVGQSLSFGPSPANWGRIFDLRKQLKKRLENTPQTHQPEPLLEGSHAGTIPEDLLAAILALQGK